MPKAVIFASRKGDVQPYTEALRRLRCKTVQRIYSPDDISTDKPPRFAVVEIFDYDQAKICNHHVADDRSPGIRMLRELRERFPECVILAVSHTSCVNGSNYVEGSLLADRAIATNWAFNAEDRALRPAALVESGLKRASEAHPIVLSLWRQKEEKGAVTDALPATE